MRKLVRGGSWDENRGNLRSSFRNVKLPDSGKGVYGSIGSAAPMIMYEKIHHK